MPKNLTAQISSATKWSALAEVMAKLVTPISTMVLARVLTPQAFGVVATIHMVIAFADIFMDAGFQRYVIHKEYDSEKDKFNTANVAFWSNFVLGILIWTIIFFFSNQLATLVGNPGLGKVLWIAALAIPVTALSSIQMAVFKHSLDFKSLFYRRLVSVIVPLIVTIPLAIWLRSYWALVWGSLTMTVVNALILTFFSPWRPKWYYKLGTLKDMLGFSTWSLTDSLLTWATFYVEIFFITRFLNDYYLGLYKTAMSTVGQFVSLITAILIPVLMPAFARAQNDFHQLREIIYKIQRYSAIILIPLGGFIFVFRVQITSILLGPQWSEISTFIGIWAIAEVVLLVTSKIIANIFPAIGKPKIGALNQFLHLIVVLPAVYIAVQYGFTALFWTRTLVRFEGIALNLFFAYKCIKLSTIKSLKNISTPTSITVLMVIICYILLLLNSENIMIMLYGPVFIIGYFIIIRQFSSEKIILNNLQKRILKESPIKNIVAKVKTK